MSFQFRTRTPSVQQLPSSGFTAGILAEDRRMAAKVAARTAVSRDEACEWARAAGFPESVVPFAAVAAVVLKSGRHGAPVLKGEVEARLRVTYPGLLEEGTVGV